MKNLHQNTPQQSQLHAASYAGFSLVGVLVSIGMVGIAVMGIAKGVSFAKWNQNDLAIKISANKFQDSMRTEISKISRNYVMDKCTGERFGKTPPQSNTGQQAAAIGTGGATAISSKSALNYAFEAVPIISGVSASFTKTPIARASVHSDAATRCNNSKDLAAMGSGEYSYFCMNFSVDPAMKSKTDFGGQSFWKLDDSFMEIMLIPVDLKTDTPIKCQDSRRPGKGVKVLYSIYYANKSGQKNGTSDIYVGKTMSNIFYINVGGSEVSSVTETQYTTSAACCTASPTGCTRCLPPSPGVPYWIAGPSSCGGDAHLFAICQAEGI
jgi:hypothetical protein